MESEESLKGKRYNSLFFNYLLSEINKSLCEIVSIEDDIDTGAAANNNNK